jgi:hypothetical protein
MKKYNFSLFISISLIPRKAIRYVPLQSVTVRAVTKRYGTCRYKAIRYGPLQSDTVRAVTKRHGTCRYKATRYVPLQSDTVRAVTKRYGTCRYIHNVCTNSLFLTIRNNLLHFHKISIISLHPDAQAFSVSSQRLAH